MNARRPDGGQATHRALCVKCLADLPIPLGRGQVTAARIVADAHCGVDLRALSGCVRYPQRRLFVASFEEAGKGNRIFGVFRSRGDVAAVDGEGRSACAQVIDGRLDAGNLVVVPLLEVFESGVQLADHGQ